MDLSTALVSSKLDVTLHSIMELKATIMEFMQAAAMNHLAKIAETKMACQI